jgi:hypothetical protein
MAKAKQNKAEQLAEQVAVATGAGKAVQMETVDFSDPNRPKTCIEVDFPILPVNQVAIIEGNAGKPIYQMSKWWARRRSSVFRSMLIAAATKAPTDEADAAKTVWDAYYANHQRKGCFRDVSVAEIFMGGGTTVVEGARLGMRMIGNDLNPVAWFITKNEMSKVPRDEVVRLLARIEQELRPQFAPYFAAKCPRGHRGRWHRISTNTVTGENFNPVDLSPNQYADYRYEGPEVAYTFWAKHGPCAAPECGHRTPIMTSPVFAIKELTVKAWKDRTCSACGGSYDVEQQAARMAPASPLVVGEGVEPFVVMDDGGRYACPHCGAEHRDEKARKTGESSMLGKAVNKKVSLSLLVHPEWLKGAPSKDPAGRDYGGTPTDSQAATARWNRRRAQSLRFVEVRGTLPKTVECPKTGAVFSPDEGTVPKKSTFTCKEATCGRDQDVLDSIKATGKAGPVAAYAQQCYCPECDREGRPYGGRYFIEPDVDAIVKAHEEWDAAKDGDLDGWWPRSELPYGFMTHHLQGGVPNHGFTHWWKMFNPKQLLVLSKLLKTISTTQGFSDDAKDFVLGAFQQYIRNQCMLAFWHIKADKLASAMSNSNFHAKNTVVESSVFSEIGLGNWESCSRSLLAALDWRDNPSELAAVENIRSVAPLLAKELKGKSEKVYPGDVLDAASTLTCGSSTELSAVGSDSVDLVITDPPFGGLLHYSELSDFFYVWIRLALKDRHPDQFGPEYTPKSLEAVANRARQPEDPDAFYQRLLTACWKESHRILKPGGLLAFTFHHSEDEPWVGVLESLFDAGFYLEATYPIRSDETKGEGEFGSKTIEYDIIHVCRKRTDDPVPISWARLRRRIADDVRQLKGILDQHKAGGLPKADLQVIRRGKALEYFSKHYGHVFVEKGRDFTLREALAGIHQLLDDEDDVGGVPPVLAEPFTRQFLRIFDGVSAVDRDQMQKYLRGTGTSPSLFEERGWCKEAKKVYNICDPIEFAKGWKGRQRKGMSRDFDQTLFLVGACFKDSGIRVEDTLNNPNFESHPAIPDLLEWMSERGGSPEIKTAARIAKTLYARWLGDHKAKADAATAQFDLPLEFA